MEVKEAESGDKLYPGRVLIAAGNYHVKLKKGARTIGQDKGSSIVYGMPKVAFEIGAVEKQVSIDNLAQTIYAIVNMG